MTIYCYDVYPLVCLAFKQAGIRGHHELARIITLFIAGPQWTSNLRQWPFRDPWFVQLAVKHAASIDSLKEARHKLQEADAYIMFTNMRPLFHHAAAKLETNYNTIGVKKYLEEYTVAKRRMETNIVRLKTCVEFKDYVREWQKREPNLTETDVLNKILL